MIPQYTDNGLIPGWAIIKIVQAKKMKEEKARVKELKKGGGIRIIKCTKYFIDKQR